IDGRHGDRGEFAWVTDPGVKHQGNLPRSRGIALWEDLVIANLPDGRVIAVNRETGEIVWDKMLAAPNEFGAGERFWAAPITADGKVIIANSAGDAKTRGWLAALDARSGQELWRWYVVPKPGDPGSETWKDKTNAWKTGGGGVGGTGPGKATQRQRKLGARHRAAVCEPPQSAADHPAPQHGPCPGT